MKIRQFSSSRKIANPNIKKNFFPKDFFSLFINAKNKGTDNKEKTS